VKSVYCCTWSHSGTSYSVGPPARVIGPSKKPQPETTAWQPLVVHSLLIVEDSRSHSHTSHSVGFPCTSDRPDARDLYQRPRRDSQARASSSSRLHDHADTPHLVGYLWTSDRPVEETSIRDHSVTVSSGPGPPHCRGFTITLTHITFGRIPLHEWSARRKRPLPETTARQPGQGLLIVEALWSLRHSTFGWIPLGEWSARRRDFYLTKNTHKGQRHMSPTGFEPTISASKRPRNHVLNCAATRTG